MIVAYLIIINFTSFLIYGIDKFLAKHNMHRVRERTLILLTLFGGAFGSSLAMVFFHHKVRKKYFIITQVVGMIFILSYIGYLISNSLVYLCKM